jgi:hypothetical protein
MTSTIARSLQIEAETDKVGSLRSQLASDPEGSAYAPEGMMKKWNSGLRLGENIGSFLHGIEKKYDL